MNEDEKMIIEVESYFGDYIIVGKKHTKNEIIKMYKDIISSYNYKDKDFTRMFCFKYNYDILKNAEQIEVDLIIDLDIRKVYKPKT